VTCCNVSRLRDRENESTAMCLTQHAQDTMNCQRTLGSNRMESFLLIVSWCHWSFGISTQGGRSVLRINTTTLKRRASRVRWLLILHPRHHHHRLTHVQLELTCTSYTSAAGCSSRPDRPPHLTHAHTHLSKVLSLPSYISTYFAWSAISTRNPPR
jgi:hypothetical protein